MIDENEAHPIDYLAHEAGYVNRHGEALEFTDDDRFTDDDGVDLYPYADEVCA